MPVVRESRGSQEDILAGAAEAAKSGFAIEKEVGPGGTGAGGSGGLKAEIEGGAAGA
jgi:hypothetical protein